MTQVDELSLVLAEVEVVALERLSPTFLRVELGSPELADFGVDGPLLDQRIKLVFPGPTGRLPSFDGADEGWYDTWLDRPEEERGHMRTYTARDVRGEGADRRVVVDFVLHLEPGASGPASRWAGAARVGDRIVLIGPRLGTSFGGIEFDPGEATRLVLAGDETAVPAIEGILAALPAGSVGAAFLEVPSREDVRPLVAPPGVQVHWLPRDGEPLGSGVVPAVVAYLQGEAGRVETVPDDDVDPEVWETPTYSSSGEALDGAAGGRAGLYCWIAGESGVVTTLRRALVRDLGVDRRQVAFMGYWRRGVSMRG